VEVSTVRGGSARATKGLNPDFLLLGETETPEDCEALDGFFPSRYLNEHGRIVVAQRMVLGGAWYLEDVSEPGVTRALSVSEATVMIPAFP
jgi:hypothetical protein